MKTLLCFIAVFYGQYSFSQHNINAIWHVADKKIDFTTSPTTISNLPLSEQSYNGDGVAVSQEGKRLMYYSNSRKGIYFEDGGFLTGSESLHGVFVPNLDDRNEFFLFANRTAFRINLTTKSLVALDYYFYGDSYPSSFIVNELCKKTWFAMFRTDSICQLYCIEHNEILEKKAVRLPEKYAITHYCFAPQSNVLALVSNQPTLSVYITRLNLETGSMEPLAQLPFDNKTTLLQTCFSPDQQRIYIAAIGKWNATTRTQPYQVIQFTLNVDFTMHSPVIIYQKELNNGIFPKMALAPDLQIYISYTVKNRYIDIISKPNLAGSACGFIENAIALNSFAQLPPAVVTWASAVDCTESLSIVGGCELMPTQFSIKNPQSIRAYLWHFGDGQTSTEAAPTHTYAAAGTYTVSLTVTKTDGSVENLSKQITVYPKPATSAISFD